MKFDLGPGVRCDLQKLIDTRALVQANSGGGKSHTLRRLLEQTHGKVQQLVIDPEGEFASLRERYDYVLAARTGGDTAADPRAAKLLAERLLQLGVSAILDIYELKAHERIRFVRHFLEALVDAPKSLWHPALVVVDEAHVFCPQQGEAESAGAVIDLCTRGRKRGFSAILATQRLSKLHKDAAAELNNKLIGRTGLDVDRKRAGEELGFTTKEQLLSLRQLEPGAFYAFGPALSLEVIQVQVGPVQTTHPKAGSRIAFTPPPPTDKVKALLPQLADLPAEAEQKQRSEAELKKDLATARATITRLERAAPVQTSAPVADQGPALRAAGAQIVKLEHALERLMKFIVEINAQDFFTAGGAAVDRAAVQKALEAAAQQLLRLVESDLGARRKALERWRRQGEQLLGEIGRLVKQDVKISVAVKHNAPFTVTPGPRGPRPTAEPSAAAPDALPRGERATLVAIAQHDQGVTREQLTVITGYKRSTRNTYLQRLGAWGLVADAGELVQATAAGVAALGDGFEPLPIGSALLEHWRHRLPKGERECLEIAVQAWPDTVSREAIGEATSFARSSRNTYLQRLGARRLVEFQGEQVRAAALLFDAA